MFSSTTLIGVVAYLFSLTTMSDATNLRLELPPMDAKLNRYDILNATLFRTMLGTASLPTLLSYHVALSPQAPSRSPWQILENLQQGLPAKRDEMSGYIQRWKRVSRSVKLSVCKAENRWTKLSHAEDIFGNNVKVAQEINIGGAVVNQYFYETVCNRDVYKRPCLGIDTTRYDSTCELKYVWAYAQVTNRFNELGWNFIKIRGSCNCALVRKSLQPFVL